jgi:reactive intermediate/imine deaminase
MHKYMEQVRTKSDPFEPFAISQAISVDPWIFVSGQAAMDENGAVIGGRDFVIQARAAFANLQAVLEAAQSSLDDVVKVTLFMTDMAYFHEVITLRREFFKPPYPADSIVEVKALALPELMFEIEAIAVRGAGKNKVC